MKPLVEGLEKQYGDKVEFRRLNVDGSDAAASQLAETLGVQYVPTFAYISKAGTVQNQTVGEQTVQQLEAGIKALQ